MIMGTPFGIYSSASYALQVDSLGLLSVQGLVLLWCDWIASIARDRRRISGFSYFIVSSSL